MVLLEVILPVVFWADGDTVGKIAIVNKGRAIGIIITPEILCSLYVLLKVIFKDLAVERDGYSFYYRIKIFWGHGQDDVSIEVGNKRIISIFYFKVTTYQPRFQT